MVTPDESMVTKDPAANLPSADVMVNVLVLIRSYLEPQDVSHFCMEAVAVAAKSAVVVKSVYIVLSMEWESGKEKYHK